MGRVKKRREIVSRFTAQRKKAGRFGRHPFFSIPRVWT